MSEITAQIVVNRINVTMIQGSSGSGGSGDMTKAVYDPAGVNEQLVGATGFAAHTSDTNNPHAVTKTQVGLSSVTNDAQIPLAQKAVSNGVASLDETGKVPSTQLPTSSGGQTLYEAIVATSGGDYTSLKDAVDDGNTRIFIRNGIYTETGSITFAAGTQNVVIVGESIGGVIIDFASNAYKLHFNGVNGNEISNILLESFTIKDGIQGYGAGVMQFDYTNEILLHKVRHKYNQTGTCYGTRFFSCDGVEVSNCTFEKTSVSGQYNAIYANISVTNAMISNNRITSTISNSGSGIRWQTDLVQIVGNYVTGFGTSIYAQSSFAHISGNYIYGMTGTTFGINAGGNSGLISGNYIYDVSTYGIYISGGFYNVVSNYVYSVATAGIVADGDYCGVKNNYIQACGDGIQAAKNRATITANNIVSCTGDAIEIQSGKDDCFVNGNRCMFNGGYGVNIVSSACDNTVVHGNHLKGNAGGILDNGIGTVDTNNIVA